MTSDASARVVIWDVDDVLNDLMRAWFDEWWRPDHPDCPIRYGDLTMNPPNAVLGISEEDYLASLDAFRAARFESLVPVRETLEWFTAHGDRGRHVALTAIPHPFAHLSAGWVVKHFGRWIRTFAFVPVRRGRAGIADHRTSKLDYVTWLGRGDVFVDDRDGNVEGARAMGLKGIVLPRPWNASSQRSLDSAFRELTGLL